ncbi:restriction endonuclease subunit S [Aliarcobacter cryaerophilus]|uniref:restriction endonuclease subunit S n=1 Tax=Aliarcobacter cryaerophilus TaxID=28198 RepID=UPI0021B1E767|nr:restriction endonuclease subunit S [Aliarcobacter cryaerophilus]MCT7507002.1 restriction endonuclease subunit S [Aliarcobacter cryaerophilus]
MGKLEKYSSYKDSGVDWLGEIPEHWKVKKLKYISIITMGQSPENNHVNQNKIGVPFLQGNAEFGNINPTEKNWCVHPKKIALKNDILYSVRAPVGAVNIADKEYCIGRGLCSIRDMKIQKSFLYYSSILFKQEFDRFSTGSTFEAISTFNIKNLKISIPPKEEQIKIASFLDSKTAQIDEAIKQKEKLIELLKERKQIVINDAVTKGLDKDVEFVDSGVEWIGKIPKDWNVEKGKRLFQQMKRPVREQDEIVTCFRDGEVTLRTNRRTDGFTNALKEHGYQGIRKGDFVIHNMDAFAGAIGISDSDGKSTPVYSVCRPWDEDLVFSEYYARYLRNLALQDFILSLAKGIRERSTDFRFKDFGELEYPLPPKEEQIKIVEYIENQTTKIDIAIELQQNYISKLKEYKASLIDSVVTGKVKVS